MPGRKSDVNDAQWLQRLHACGLLRPSFQPERDIAALRAYLRLRERHLDYAAAHIQHMQKALTLMNLQLHHVVSEVTGVTGMQIIRAIVAGQRDLAVVATMRDVRCKATIETVRAALVGNYQTEHVFELTQALALMFSYRRRDRVKILSWERNGFWLLLKRLEKDRFIWPSLDAVPLLTAEQLHWLLEGTDIAVVQRHHPLRYASVA